MTQESSQPLMVLFHHLGPYHIARLNGAAEFGPVVCLELSSTSETYDWEDKNPVPINFQRVSLFHEVDSRTLDYSTLYNPIKEAIQSYNPIAVAINGWWDNGARAALSYCTENKVPTILMSETQADDAPRKVFPEWIKSQIVSLFQTAIVGGISHKKYLQKLGMDSENVLKGYDIVDNDFFSEQNQVHLKNESMIRDELGIQKPFFLASNRFIEKKNLHLLIECYSDYRLAVDDPWDLVLLGDGDLKHALELQVKFAKLRESVHFEGFKQIDEIVRYYALAECFIHLSTHEQWGLVINEAMASGIPVIASKKCGATREMLRNEKNSLVVSPFDRGEIVQAMTRMHQDEELRKEMTIEALHTVQKYSPRTFGENIWLAAKKAEALNSKNRVLPKFILSLMNKWNQLPTRRVT